MSLTLACRLYGRKREHELTHIADEQEMGYERFCCYFLSVWLFAKALLFRKDKVKKGNLPQVPLYHLKITLIKIHKYKPKLQGRKQSMLSGVDEKEN